MRKQLFALVLLSVVTNFAHAKNDDFKDFYASRFEQLASRVKKTEDLYKKLPLTDKARELIKKDVEGKKFDFEKISIEMPDSQTVVMKTKGSELRFGFGRIDEAILLVNGKKIEVTAQKTYLNYKNEIAKIASERKTSMISIFVDRAEAQEYVSPEEARAVADTEYRLGAAALYAMFPEDFKFNTLRNSMDATLAANLSRAFEQDLKDRNPDNTPSDQMVVGDGTPSNAYLYHVPAFTCANGRLSMLGRVEPRGNQWVPTTEILRRTANGWTYQADPSTPIVTLDTNFKVTGTAPGLAAKGVDFRNHVQNPWRYFPTLADRCCAQEGCWQQVNHAAQANFRERRTEERSQSMMGKASK